MAEQVVRQGKVFISYSRSDSIVVEDCARRLREAGVDIWFDQFDIPRGQPWDVEIERALRQCPRMVVFLSSASVQSRNVRDEINDALDRQAHLIPVLIEPCESPLRLSRLQRFDFVENRETRWPLLVDLLRNGVLPGGVEEPGRRNGRRGTWPGAGTIIAAAAVAVALLVGLAAWLAVRVPDVQGLSEAEAERTLQAAGFEVVSRGAAENDRLTEGAAFNQLPAAGGWAVRGSRVTFLTASAPALTIPSLAGLTRAAAAKLLAQSGLKVGRIERQPTSQASPDTVVDQAPSQGTRTSKGSAVDLVVAAAQSAPPPALNSVPATPPKACVIAGRIFREETGEPLRGVYVDVSQYAGDVKSMTSVETGAATSGPDGAFRINCDAYAASSFPLRLTLRRSDWLAQHIVGAPIERDQTDRDFNFPLKPEPKPEDPVKVTFGGGGTPGMMAVTAKNTTTNSWACYEIEFRLITGKDDPQGRPAGKDAGPFPARFQNLGGMQSLSQTVQLPTGFGARYGAQRPC